MLSPLLSLPSYLRMLKATPNLAYCLQQWQVQSTSKKGPTKPIAQANRFAYGRAVSDWFYAGFEDTASLLFFKIQIRFWFSLEIFLLWPIIQCNRGIYFNSLHIIPFPFICYLIFNKWVGKATSFSHLAIQELLAMDTDSRKLHLLHDRNVYA